MTRIEELTLKMLEGMISEEEMNELDWTVASDPAAARKHIALLELEATLRGMRTNVDVVGRVMGQLVETTGQPAPAEPAAATGFEAEPQTPTGKFTTAAEVKPILGMTRGNWVAVREFEGRDLLYVTHLLSWRCGLHEIRFAVNDGPMQVWKMPPCLTDTAQPNAIPTEGGLPFREYDLGSIESVSVELLYDDLSTESARFERQEVLMP